MAIRIPPPPDSLRTRVLSVGPIPPEWGGRLRGGVTRFHAALVGEWKRRPWRHRIEPIGILIPPPQRLMRWKADERSPVPVFMPPEEGRPRRFTGLLLRERLKPDVVVVNNVPAFAPARYTRVHEHVAPEIPMLGIVHAWHQVTMKRDDERADKNRKAAQDALERCKAVVFGSEHCRKEGLELGFRYPERTAVIPYPLQKAYTKDFEMVPASERSGVVFLASLNERKNPIALLEAIARMPGERVTFAGEGDEEQRLRDRAEELGIADRVEFVPHMRTTIHIKRMRKLVRNARVLCLPSLSESFGIVMIEALASGTPVVGFGPTFTEIRDRLGIDIGEPVWDGTPEEVQAGLESVLGREWKRDQLRKRTVARYSVESIASEYARLVRKVAR